MYLGKQEKITSTGLMVMQQRDQRHHGITIFSVLISRIIFKAKLYLTWLYFLLQTTRLWSRTIPTLLRLSITFGSPIPMREGLLLLPHTISVVNLHHLVL